MIIIIILIISFIVIYLTFINKVEKFINFTDKYSIGILDNSIKKKHFFNANMEMSNTEMENILEKIKKKKMRIMFKNNRDIKQKLYTNIQQFLLNEINNPVQNKYRLFSIINKELIKYKKNRNDILISFILEIYRNAKYSSFQLYISTIYNKNNKIAHFKEIKLIANKSSQDLFLLPGYSKEYIQLYRNYNDNIQYNGDKTYIRNSNNNDILPSKTQNIEIKDNRLNDKIRNFINKSYKCYGSKGNDIYNCLSDKNIMGLSKKKGIWDRVCYTNDDCPFYKANKNYDNTRGGCINGTCEMPFNVKNLTYRYYDINTKPYCYNCKNNTNDCCSDQMKENPKMKSPDYMFQGDLLGRYENKEQLMDKNLVWYNKQNNILINLYYNYKNIISFYYK